jgi:hypothetical protein
LERTRKSGTLLAQPTARRHARWRTWLARLGGIALGLLLAWLLLEVLLRVGFDVLSPRAQGAIENVRVVPWDEARLVPVPPFNWDTDYQRVLQPGLHNFKLHTGQDTIHIDSISLWGSRVGLRSRPPQWPMQVAVFGDSFSMCFVEFKDCWVERLHSDYGWSVMNLGETSTGTRAHLQMLKTFGIPLQPQIVVWQWYGNDFNDDYGLGLLRGEYAPMDQAPQLTPGPDFGWLAQYSAVYATIRDWLWRATHEPPHAWGRFVDILGTKMRVGDDYNLYGFDLSRPSNAYGYQQTVEALDEAASLIRDDLHAELVIVLIPTKEEVYASYLTDVLSQVYLDNLSEGRQRMLALCATRGWRCLDATDALRAAADSGELLYHWYDLHINPRGNAIVAKLVGDYLLQEGLLPGS